MCLLYITQYVLHYIHILFVTVSYWLFIPYFIYFPALDASGAPESGFLLGNNLWIGSHAECADISNRKPLEINYNFIPHADPTPYDYPPYDMRFVMAIMKHNSTLQQHTHMPLDVSFIVISFL